MTFEVQIDDESTRLEVDRQGDRYRFRLGGRPERQAQLTQVEPGIYSVLLDGRSYEAHAETGNDCAWITIRGHRFRVAITDPRRWSAKRAGAHGHEREEIVAPMPGKIVRLLVELAQVVKVGQGIVVMEAMKMQNELKAHRAGRVASIPVHTGDTVGAGAIVATVE
jgi:biotin carboxyl carrier protein